MKTSIAGVILICGLFAPWSLAQRAGGPGGGHGPQPSHSGGHSNTAPGFVSGFRPARNDFGRNGFTGPWWGLSSPAYDYGNRGSCEETPQPPQAIIVSPPVQAPPPSPPARPEPVAGLTREYNWPETANNSAGVFSIVSKDGAVRYAKAVWVDNGTVHFTTPDGTALHTPIASLDRDATRRLNAEKHLALSLPAAESE